MERLWLNERQMISRCRAICCNLYWNNGLALTYKYLVGIEVETIDLDSSRFQVWSGSYSHKFGIRAGLLDDGVVQHA